MGTSNYGHYYAFLRPTTEERWFEFNDSSVTEVSPDKAIDENFGGTDNYYYRNFSAYMLIYVRNDLSQELFEPVPMDAIPHSAVDYIEVEQERDR
jgi:ubiquitin carboxyl-terminal hydrolase 7